MTSNATLNSSPTIRPVHLQHDLLFPRCLAIRVVCWVVALGLGAAQAWVTRFTMNSDGVSYLDIGDAYWRGDWHNAINTYWSPLYSWILGFFIKVLRPSALWEYPVVHLANLVIFSATLIAFDFFLSTVIAHRSRRDEESADAEAMPDTALWLIGYSLFLDSTVGMVGLHLVTPDMCVVGFVFLASAILLRIRQQPASRVLSFWLGVVMGFAYLAKAIMFPVGIAFLATASFIGHRSQQWKINTAAAALTFAVIAGPFMLTISLKSGHLTFGESGRLTYAATLNGIDMLTPGDSVRVVDLAKARASYGTLEHPATRILNYPETFWFATPISGTYPPWYDLAYWQAGVKPRFDFRAELWALLKSLGTYADLFTTIHLNVIAPFITLLLISERPSRTLQRYLSLWPVLLPSAVALVLYCAIQTEFRYIAGFVGVLFVFAFEPLRFPLRLRMFLVFTSLAVTVTTILSVAKQASNYSAANRNTSLYWQVAEGLRDSGLKAGDPIATLGREPARDGAYIARLARLRIVAQVSNPTEFWTASKDQQEQVLDVLRKHGCKGVFAWDAPRTVWTQIGKYSLLRLDRPKRGQQD